MYKRPIKLTTLAWYVLKLRGKRKGLKGKTLMRFLAKPNQYENCKNVWGFCGTLEYLFVPKVYWQF